MHHHRDNDRREREERERRHEEEERHSSYSGAELGEDWQFKIVRGNFSSADSVQAVINEQAYFGWVFVEKFDHLRIRFKRKASEALRDAARQGDPYATQSVVASGGCLVVLGFFALLSLGAACAAVF